MAKETMITAQQAFVERWGTAIEPLSMLLAYESPEQVDYALFQYGSRVVEQMLRDYPRVDENELGAWVYNLQTLIRMRKSQIEQGRHPQRH